LSVLRIEDGLRIVFRVNVSAAHAFGMFTEGFQAWWPREYSWSGPALERIGIEPGVGGFCFEVGPHGFRCDWGRVLEWDPPTRLVFSWQIGPDRVPEPDPAKASVVGVGFVAEQPAVTRVEFEHTHFSRHGEAGAEYRDALSSEAGWPYMLANYVLRLHETVT
jgi:uncharacterized protein YndB with AHSA1/START domain